VAEDDPGRMFIDGIHGINVINENTEEMVKVISWYWRQATSPFISLCQTGSHLNSH
jgi:hypothetical protein